MQVSMRPSSRIMSDHDQFASIFVTGPGASFGEAEPQAPAAAV